jgi:hypothetical protein
VLTGGVEHWMRPLPLPCPASQEAVDAVGSHAGHGVGSRSHDRDNLVASAGHPRLRVWWLGADGLLSGGRWWLWPTWAWWVSTVVVARMAGASAWLAGGCELCG